MGLLNKLLSSKHLQNEIVPMHKSLDVLNDTLKIHPGIRDLLWIADGPGKNYIPSREQNIYEYEGFRITVSLGTDTEPSLMSTKQPITIVNDISTVEKPPYFPTYAQLSSEQRGVYWKLLENPYNPTFDIGFVFILYYGLERHLLDGKFEKAFDVILKLRDVHRNGSFQSYSACALILTSLFRQRADLAMKFFGSLDKEHELNFSNDLYLLCKFGLGIPLTCKDMMRLAKTFEFTNTNYIKKYPQLFEDNLQKRLLEKYDTDAIDMKRFVSEIDWRKLKKQPIPMFANISIPNRYIEVPMISDSFKLKKVVYDMLEAAHEATKSQLAQMRKAGTVPEETAPKMDKTVINPIELDIVQEQQLLEDLNKNGRSILNKHFTYIALQDFYYKYRDLDEKYLQKCIDYCIEDIMMLPDVQKYYYKEETECIQALASVYGKKKTAEELKAIKPFNGAIPAFYRLTVIYEKRRNFTDAMAICDKAIKYYDSIGMNGSALEFKRRREKLEAKSQK